MSGWPRILWDFEGGLDDAHLQNLKIARRESFQSVKRCFFTRPVMTLCEPVIVILFIFIETPSTTVHSLNIILQFPNNFLHPNPPPHSQNHHGCSCHSTTLNHRRNAATTSVFTKSWSKNLRSWSFNSARSTDRDFLQSSLCLSLLSRRFDYRSLPRIHQTFACVSARSCVWSIPTLFSCFLSSDRDEESHFLIVCSFEHSSMVWVCI